MVVTMRILARQVFVLLKLRIGFAMMLTAGMGIAVTAGGTPSAGQVFLLLTAILLSAGAAGGLNHYHDHDIDARMTRTHNRPFASGQLPHSPWWLFFFAMLLVVPVVAVWRYINATAALYVFLGAFFYGVVYTIWLKRRTWLNIVIGGLAGSFAVLAGTATVDPDMTPLAASLAFILFLWTPSHFWSLAIALKKEYQSVNLPMLPVVAGEMRAAKVVLANTTLLVVVSLVPFFLGLGWLYLAGAVIGGGYFLSRSLILTWDPTPIPAMANFRASLVHLFVLLVAASFDGRMGPWAT
ncbi:MAG: protoheme IX farnesyltransferase [Magnetococcales bacterium]|nr:protoheme IX farnesyltransferase [Magnetococcales bacterium]